VAGELNLSAGAAKVAAHRLRRRYRDLLRQELAQTVADPAEVDEEITWLFKAIA
jgi:RNA polymerase sigma-70 factor (ECF subfamily)